jgi:uroporphyrinogen III methyltransferase/synthase
VTHRGLATHVTIVTGHEDPAKGRTDVDWEALARAGGTLVILMGAGHIPDIATRLQAGGRAGDTPVAAIRWGTTAQHRSLRTTLAEVATAGVESPSAIVVGAVAALDLAWFERRPLLGRRVVVTRAREQASALRARLEALGAAVVELPAIHVETIPVDVPALDGYEWLILTSANGVRRLFENGLAPRGLDARALHGLKIACIGPGTARTLAEHGIVADLVPPRFVAESLLDAFPTASKGDRVLLARAEAARDVLPEGLRAKGYEVDVLPVYRTVRAAPDADDLDAVRGGGVDAITFTSSSTVEHFCEIVGEFDRATTKIVSIGPITSETARAHGLTVDIEADPHDIDGLVAAVAAVLGDHDRR